ncbi:MAG: DNA methyltransferase, partial [Phycisphaerales bacterium]
PRNGILKLDYEFILIFKKQGTAPAVSKEIKEQSRMTTEEWNQFFAGHWNIPGERQEKHLAVFPEEIPGRLIRMFTFVGDTVLDPFLGSGTTCLAARNLGRNSVGYEINPDYREIIREKLGLRKASLFQDAHFEVLKQAKSETDLCTLIVELPYVFHDPVQFDKKVDPRNLHFGSKVNHESHKRDEYHRVREVLSPERLVLGDGVKIRLLGIREDDKTRQQAMRFLEEKTLGQRVTVKFDTVKFDRDNNLLCYLYLQNKTFINAHLVRTGLVSIDTEMDYRLKEKFSQLLRMRKAQK